MEHGFTTTMPSEIETFRLAATQHTTHKETIKLSPVFPSWKGDSKNDRGSTQVRSLVGPCTCHSDRDSSTMEWFGALYDGASRKI